MVDTSGYGQHEAASRRLGEVFSRTADHVNMGIRLDHRWSRASLAMTENDRVWTFARKRDAVQLLTRLAGHRNGSDTDAVARCLKERFGAANLVLHAGSRGAVLMNGHPCPYHVSTCPIKRAHTIGAGDVLLSVTTLASACGTDDRACVSRGVAAATGHVAGLDLPVELEELDVG